MMGILARIAKWWKESRILTPEDIIAEGMIAEIKRKREEARRR